MNKIILILLALFEFNSAYSAESDCRIDSIYNFTFNSDSSKTITSKQINLYNSKGLLISDVSQSLIAASNSWENRRKREYLYNLNGNYTQVTNFEWNEKTKSLENSIKFEYIYDNNLLILEKGYTWDKSWENTSQIENSYNIKGLKSEYIYKYWSISDNKYFIFYKYKYDYNFNNQLTQAIKLNWDSDLNIYISEVEFNYLYNEKGLKTQYLRKNLNEQKKELVNSFKADYSYNNEDLQTEDISNIWGENDSKWYPYAKTNSNYNALGNKTKGNYQLCDTPKTNWHNSQIIEYHYTSNDCLQTYDLYYDWNSNTNKYDKHTQIEYFTSMKPTSAESEILPASFLIFPNPTNNVIEFPIGTYLEKDINIYSIDGQLVIQIKAEKNRIDISNLQNGTYFIKLSDKFYKFIKE